MTLLQQYTKPQKIRRFCHLLTRIKRNSVTKKSDLKKENSFEMERFLENFRAIKQSSSQQTKKYLFWSVVLKRVKVPKVITLGLGQIC